MKYSIVIPTYNHCEDLLKPCVESILRYSKLDDIELIISANGCTDGTLSYLGYLKSCFDTLFLSNNLKIVWNDKPLGYPAATNAGIKVATSDLIILLNNDTVLLDQRKNTWLEILEGPFSNEKCGISCLTKFHSDCAGHEFAVFFCVMIHRKVFDKIGLLSLEYGMGAGEDTEFCIEATRAGFEILDCTNFHWSEQIHTFVGTFPIWHKVGRTMHDPSLGFDYEKTMFVNSLKLAKKYNPAWYKEQIEILLKEQDAEIFKEIFTDNTYRITKEIIKDKCVIDIGANVGTFSIFANLLGAKRVIAVEPVADTYKKLSNNVETFSLSNIKTINRIVSNKDDEQIKIYLDAKPGHNNIYDVKENFETVDSITLKEILKDCKENDILLKLDCEGSEYDILLNASYEDMMKIDRILMEIHTQDHPIYKGFEILHDKLNSFGFSLEHFDQVYYWNYNEKGEVVNWRPIDYRIEFWKRNKDNG